MFPFTASTPCPTPRPHTFGGTPHLEVRVHPRQHTLQRQHGSLDAGGARCHSFGAEDGRQQAVTLHVPPAQPAAQLYRLNKQGGQHMRSASGRGVSVTQAEAQGSRQLRSLLPNIWYSYSCWKKELLLLAAARTMSWPMCVSCPILQPPGRRGMSCRAGKAGDNRSDESRRKTGVIR